MTIELLRAFLLYCTLINFGVLFLWFFVFTFAKGWMHRMHGRWFKFSDEQFDMLHYGLMGAFKLAVLLFNVVPLAALWIVG